MAIKKTLKQFLILLALFVGAALLAASFTSITAGAAPASAIANMPSTGASTAQVAGDTTAQFYAGNYCMSCHVADPERVQAALLWNGAFERQAFSPCPASRALHEEIYYTERLLLAIDRLVTSVPDSSAAQTIQARLTGANQTYSRLLDTPIFSQEAFVSEAQTLRYRLGKLFTQLNQMVEAQKIGNVLIFAAISSLILLASLIWGYRNAHKASIAWSTPSRSAARKSRNLWVQGALVVLIVFGIFTLPIFRTFPQAAEMTAPEDQERQTILDTARRNAQATDRAIARAVMIASVGAGWAELDQEAAKETLQTARLENAEVQASLYALWGESQLVREAAGGNLIAREQAGLIANQLQSTQWRVWGLNLMGQQWANLDPVQAEEILNEALTNALSQASQTNIYYDLDLRSLAVIWANLDAKKAIDVAQKIQDPALRAWALREIALVAEQPAYYQQAAEAARQIGDPYQRGRALREIALQAGTSSLFEEALQAVNEILLAAQKAYGLSELAADWQNSALVDQIDPAYPAARAYAFYRLGQFENAWQEAAQIEDPYERARAQAAIASGWNNDNAALQIDIPLYQSIALRDITQNRGDLSLVKQIPSVYHQVQALTMLGEYDQAWQEGQKLSDTYPLLALAVRWANDEPSAALDVVEKMEREVDKAEALRAVTVSYARLSGNQASLNPAFFERALNMALAARRRGDALAPARASLALALDMLAFDNNLALQAFQQALNAALAIR